MHVMSFAFASLKHEGRLKAWFSFAYNQRARMQANDALDAVHQDIDECRRCESLTKGFSKPTRLKRGDAGRIVVVGQGPGNAELKRGVAFAGQSGRRLEEWLVKCGADPQCPRKGIYFTSIIKCSSVGGQSDYSRMVRMCSGFLQRQIEIISPSLIITLGRPAFEELRVTAASYEESLCQLYETRDHVLVTRFGRHFSLLHWPHPSGLNHWHNDASHREQLFASFAIVRAFLETA